MGYAGWNRSTDYKDIMIVSYLDHCNPRVFEVQLFCFRYNLCERKWNKKDYRSA